MAVTPEVFLQQFWVNRSRTGVSAIRAALPLAMSRAGGYKSGMTTLALIRHAAHDLVGHTIVGRASGVRLSLEGVRQAEALAGCLGQSAISTLYSSPLERALETAAPIAARLGLGVVVAEELNEIDFGAWTGRSVAELNKIEAWRQFNLFRSSARIAEGETMAEVQARFLRLVERLCAVHAGQTVALVSHGDVIKAALAHYLGVHLDLFQRIEISPASLSLVRLSPYGPQVLLVNGFAAERLPQPEAGRSSPTAR
jgi:probable phosphomutase (TIGR03848 family)